MNLGFHKGTLLDDKKGLLHGTGKLIRHIPITAKDDFGNKDVEAIILNSIQFAKEEMDIKRLKKGMTISKIKITH